MSGHGGGEGVQVVSVREDGSYGVCAEALRSVLARPELRALPVAVLSVAGATRGGKSFLLDFLLRYLRATPSARADGSWLGGEDEPLVGFSWRGGCERDTVGIHLWSEPFVLTRDNGEEVVVLLMDTQGTFDSSSTIRDSTTVFAMSTLLSSVQIFNISMNIQEDHLQYLQLFTEYGKLAKGESGTPFQVLQFLVRDWSCGYEYPVGAGGGQHFLEKRLQVHDNQPEELREIRQHIKSSFESVRCFLMPHPGLTVAASPNFIGCLSDITKEFREALLELVRGLFEENLTMKKINGQVIQVQELMGYFESYMEVFRSDQLPSPVTILTATSSACLEAALSLAREVFRREMELSCEARSVPRGVMPRLHASAKDAARTAFLARRTLASPEAVAERLTHLLKEFDDLLANYIAFNDAKTQALIAESKESYEKHMLNIDKCLLLSELEERHQEAMSLAINLFDSSRVPVDDGEDEKRRDLQEELINFLDFHEEIILKNEAKIKAALNEALKTYTEGVLIQTDTVPSICVLDNQLLILHRAAKNEALSLFESRWKSQESSQNEHKTALLAEISAKFNEISSINETNNNNAVQKAIKFYEDSMLNILGVNGCFHPLDFLSEHNIIYNPTVAEFYRCRTYENQEAGRDNYKLELIKKLSNCLTKYKTINEERNKRAVKTAHTFYEQLMRVARVGGVPEFLGPPDFEVMQRHRTSKPLAINVFKGDLRRPGPRHAEDTHMEDLIKLIDATYRWLLLKFVAMGVITIASFVFLRRLW